MECYSPAKFMAIFCLLLVCLAAFGDEVSIPAEIPVSRYSYVSTEPLPSQRNIMVSVIEENFGDEFQTVGDAVQYLLHKYGYRIGQPREDESQYYLLMLPLPLSHRSFDPFPLISALALLGGEGFDLVVDPVRREVSYRLDPEYRSHLEMEEIQAAKSAWLARHPIASLDISNGSTADGDCIDTTIVRYGPVVPGESLLPIALQLKSDAVTDAQAVMAIFDHNPTAFNHHNVNFLKVGAQLTIPAADVMRAMPDSYARQRLWEHHREWQTWRTSGTNNASPSPAGDVTP